MGGTQEPQAVEIVALNDQVAVVRGALGRVAEFRYYARLHHIGVERRVACDGIALPVQTEFLFGEVFYQQAAELLGVEVLKLRQK